MGVFKRATAFLRRHFDREGTPYVFVSYPTVERGAPTKIIYSRLVLKPNQVFNIGRNEHGNHLVIPSNRLTSTVSRKHWVISNIDGVLRVADRESWQGTWLNRKRIAEGVSTALNDGDVITNRDQKHMPGGVYVVFATSKLMRKTLATPEGFNNHVASKPT